MKIKILIFPLCLVFSFIILVMYAKPEFSNIGVTKAEIRNKENILSEIKLQNERIDSLIRDLNANQDKESLIFRYLPKSKEEELIINSVFQSVVNSSIFLSNLGIIYQPKLFDISPQFKNSLSSGVPEQGIPDPSLPAGPTSIDVINVKLSMVGTYENIKTFLNQIFTMEKENNITSVKIYKNQISNQSSPDQSFNQSPANQPGESGNTNNLNIDIGASFDNIPLLNLKNDAIHPVFSRSDFDFSVTGDIEKIFNRKVPAIDGGSAGKSNPFLP